MRSPLSPGLLLLAAVCTLAPSAAQAVPLYLHVDASVLYVFDTDGSAYLGIQPGTPVTIDLYYDPELADSYDSGGTNYAQVGRFLFPSPGFSLTATVGSVTFSTAWSYAGAESAISAGHPVSPPEDEYFITSRLGNAPGCSPACVDFDLLFYDDVAPYDMINGNTVLQIPDLSAVTHAGGQIVGGYTGGYTIDFSYSASSFSLQAVPEPGKALLGATGLAVLALGARAGRSLGGSRDGRRGVA